MVQLMVPEPLIRWHNHISPISIMDNSVDNAVNATCKENTHENTSI